MLALLTLSSLTGGASVAKGGVENRSMNTASGRGEIALGATSAPCSYRNDLLVIGGSLSQGAALARLRDSGEHEI